MIFKRTSSGLSNQHLFLNVDFVVLVEGGPSLSKCDVLSGKVNKTSIDILFWRGLFSHYLPKMSFKVRGVGSKSILKSIAADIADENLKNVLVGMDRDFDNYDGCMVNAKGVFYTWGYSWENDVTSTHVIVETLLAICPADVNRLEILNEIEKYVNELSAALRWPLYADVLLFMYGKTLLPREKPMSAVKLGTTRAPYLDIQRIRLLLKDLRSSIKTPIKTANPIILSVIRDCPGHLLSCFIYHFICFLLRKRSNIKHIPRHFIDTTLISQFHIGLKGGYLKEIYEHYESQFAQMKH